WNAYRKFAIAYNQPTITHCIAYSLADPLGARELRIEDPAYASASSWCCSSDLPIDDGPSLSFFSRGTCTLRAYSPLLPQLAPGRSYASTIMTGSTLSCAIRLIFANCLSPADSSAIAIAHLFALIAMQCSHWLQLFLRLQPIHSIMPRAQDRSMRSPWPNSHNSPAYQFNRGMPTGSASSQLSQWQRLNAGLSGPLAFEQDFSALDDPAASHDTAYAHEPLDFHDDGTPPALDSVSYQGPLLDGSDVVTEQARFRLCPGLSFFLSPFAFEPGQPIALPITAQEALRAWLNFLSPEERRAAESAMGATLPSSAQASDEPAHVIAPDEPTPAPSQADPSTTPIPEEPNSSLLAQREWYDSQDKIFQGLIPPETPWQDDDLSAQPTSSASPLPMPTETSTEPQAPDQKPWLLPKPDTRLFNIFGDSFELQAIKENIAKGQKPPCLYKDPAAVDQQPLNRQELWAAMQYKPIYRTAGKWTYWDLLPDDIRKPPPQFCNEIEDAPKQPPASRLQPKEKVPKKDSWADATEQEDTEPLPKPMPAKPAQATQPSPGQPLPSDRPGSSKDDIQDLSSTDPASIYKPLSGQDLHIDAFRSLDQPGAFTQPYLFDVDLLDRRAQPLYAQPHYKPIECMMFDKRPLICFYGGSMPAVVAETDGFWYTMYDREGGCCLPGWPMFLLQDFMRLFADPPPSPEPTTQADAAASSPRDFARDRFPLPANYRSAFGRFWHLGCAGTHNPRSLDPPSRPPTVQLARGKQPRDIPGKKGPVAFPEQPWIMHPGSLEHADDHKGLPAPSQETDTSVVGELHQEAQNALGPAARQVGMVSRASQETSRKEALLKKSLEKFTAGTLERYIAAAKQFLDFLGLSNRTIASIDVAFLADFLHACENSLEEDRDVCKIGPRPILKALSWLGRHAEVPAIQPLLQASLIRAFLTQPSSDRKEALPLPMAVVVEWERKAAASHCIASKFAFSRPEHKSAPQKKLANIKGWRPARPIARGGQPPTLEPPFHVDRSQPQPPYQVSSFGEGVSRFVYSREVSLESLEPLQPAEDSQGSQDDLRPKPTAAQIPQDDTEALLVEKFANQAHSSAESEQEPQDHGVHEILYQALALKGLESVDDFAYASPEIRSLEALLSGLSDTDLADMGATDQYHGVQAARIRKALRFAHDLCQQPIEPSQSIPQPPSLQAAILPQASPASWVENLPPKLSQEAAQELIDDFKTNYPGELLDEDTMPSIRLLSLVQHSLKPGEKIRWIPWQFRLSSKQYTEIMEAKSSKPMRTEAQLLASALYDDTPEMPVAHLRLSASWLAFDKRVLDLALPDLADNSLRGSLVSAGWSLDEALYEADTQPQPPADPTLVAGQDRGVDSHGEKLANKPDNILPPAAKQPLPPKGTNFSRKFANRVWTSPAYKKARQQERFDPPQVLLLDTSILLGTRCKALADPEAIPFLETSPQPSEQESSRLLQCLWSRSIIAVIAALPTLARNKETAVSIMQAVKASAAFTLLTEQAEALTVLCSALELDQDEMENISPGLEVCQGNWLDTAGARRSRSSQETLA
ncbi:unnamed protein product, partial [Symbiodinium sp. KB8]